MGLHTLGGQAGKPGGVGDEKFHIQTVKYYFGCSYSEFADTAASWCFVGNRT